MDKAKLFSWALVGTKWLSAVAVIASIVSFGLLRFKILSDWESVGIFFLIAFAGLFALVAESGKLAAALDRKIDKLLVRSEKRTWSIEECLADFTSELGRVQSSEAVSIRFLTLGMREGVKYIRRLLLEGPFRALEIEVLVLTSDSNNLANGTPDRVKHWCEQAKDSLRSLRKSLPEAVDLARIGKRAFKLTVKQYSEVPFVHGFSMTRPLSLTYCAFCRWATDDEYEWSKESYRVVKGTEQGGVPMDDFLVFDSFFHHLWRTSGDPVIEATEALPLDTPAT